MKSKDFLKEGFVEDAASSHQDHEVQMARKDCYYAAEHALAIHKLLKHVNEIQGIEGWVAAKITLASDYLNTVREYLEYEMIGSPEPQETTAAMSVKLPIAEGSVKQLMMDIEELRPAEFKKKYNKTKEEVKKQLPSYQDKSKDSKKPTQGVAEGLKDPKDNPCWKGYHPVGTKKKNGKTVPNCVPGRADEGVAEASSPAQQAAIAINMKKHHKKPKSESVDEAQGDNPAIGVDQMAGKEKLRPHTGVGPEPGTLKHKTGKMAHAVKAFTDFVRGKPERMGHLEEMTAASVATVNNPDSKKPKNQVGSLFGGTYGETKPSKKIIKR